MDANERLLRSAEELLQNRDDPRAKQAIVEAHAADLAHVLQHLPPSDRAIIFRILGPEQAGDVLSELDDATLLGLVRSLDDVEVSQILDRMPAEHAADVVDELSTEHAEKILDLMEEERSEEIQEILEYPEDSAGRLMSPDVVAVRETSTVEEAVQHIRKTVTEERPFGVYAVDDHQHLIGRVPLRRLLLADPRSLILGILDEEEVVSVNATMDREEMARVVAKYDLVTVPVVDDQNRLIGTITVDDVIDVVEEEASEDIFRMAGSDAAELERRSPGQVAMLRLPWVMLTLLIEMLAGVVIHFFDHTLGKVILLASFMPVIQAISGNTGLQSVTMVVRGLVGAAMEADPDLGDSRCCVRGSGRPDRAHVALGHLWPGCRHLDVRLGQSFWLRRDGHPHALEAHGLRPGLDGRPIRDRLPGRPGRDHIPVARYRPSSLASLTFPRTYICLTVPCNSAAHSV
jgi:magnesium transporter